VLLTSADGRVKEVYCEDKSRFIGLFGVQTTVFELLPLSFGPEDLDAPKKQ